jgi:hypothetical protein
MKPAYPNQLSKDKFKNKSSHIQIQTMLMQRFCTAIRPTNRKNGDVFRTFSTTKTFKNILIITKVINMVCHGIINTFMKTQVIIELRWRTKITVHINVSGFSRYLFSF